MKKPMLAAGIAAISACSQPMDDEQKALVERYVVDAEVFLPAVQELVRAADPLVDAHGNDAVDNEVVADDIAETVATVRYYFDNDRILTWDNEQSDDRGKYPDVLTPHSVEDDHLYLNVAHADEWDASLLVHEAGHRYKLHSLEMVAYRNGEDVLLPVSSGGDGGEAYMEKVLEEKDYPELVEHLIYAINGPVYQMAEAVEAYCDGRAEEAAKGTITMDEVVENCDVYFARMTETSREDWAREQASLYTADLKMMEVIGIGQQTLEQTLLLPGIFEHAERRLQERYAEKIREYNEAEESVEAKQEVRHEYTEGRSARR